MDTHDKGVLFGFTEGLCNEEGPSRLHADVLKMGLPRKSSSVARALVSLYAKCGAIEKAMEMIEGFSVRDMVAWNAVLIGYALQGRDEEALSCFEKMQHAGLSPDKVTYTCILKVCSKLKAIDKGEHIHDEIVRQGLLENDIILGTALVNMYAKCGILAKAQHVLEDLSMRDVVAWNILIAGYAEQGQGHEALSCFDQMQLEGLSPSGVSFMCALKACGSIRAVEKGKQLHDEIAKQGLLEGNIALSGSLVDMYTKCGALVNAQQLLEELPMVNAVLWNALIVKCTELGKGEEALKCFEHMQWKGISPDDVTFICALKACGSIGAIDTGEQIHDQIKQVGLLGTNPVLGNALLDMYAKCGALAKAHEVLKELPVRDVVSWSALIAGYAQQGKGRDALHCFREMQNEGLSPSTVTYICILQACASIGAADKGEQFHKEIVRQGLLETSSSPVLGNGLVDMYAKCGAFSRAVQVLEELPLHDVVSWNALIAGYTQQGHGQDALDCFRRMQRKGLSPDEVTFTCILKACGTIGAAEKGESIHDEIAKQGLLAQNAVLGNALLDMYIKCGALDKAQRVFEELPARNVVSWSTLIAGYAHHGQVQEAVRCFSLMQHEGLTPNMITFSSVLNACSHAGLVDEGQKCFKIMVTQYGITPVVEHLTGIVDLLGRAGRFDTVVEVMRRMPSLDNPAVWSAMLSACQKWGGVDDERWAFDNAIQLDKRDVMAYLCMSRIYTTAGIQEGTANNEARRAKHEAWLRPGPNQESDCGESDLAMHAQSRIMHPNPGNVSCKISREGYIPLLQCAS